MFQTIRCSVHFVAPAFLGDADQKGSWRTPPFKALLRQWWRIAVAGQLGYDYTRLREKEGKLFGHTWLTNCHGKTWAMQGRVRLKLDRWESGALNQWPKDPKVTNNEVDRNPQIGSHLYLGYGPLTFQRGHGTALKKGNPAIDAMVDVGSWVVAFPREEGEQIIHALQLIHWFGSLGGRSRNGWGSLSLSSHSEGAILPADDLLEGTAIKRLAGYSRRFEDCLKCDWPHAFGQGTDGRLLVWKTCEFTTWSDTVRELARVKIAFRQGCSVAANRGAHRPVLDERHILAYPVTNHEVDDWGNQKRLANQLRFKLLRLKNGRFIGLAYQLPHRLPDALRNSLKGSDKQKPTPEWQLAVWRKVHGVLDSEMTRIERAPQ